MGKKKTKKKKRKKTSVSWTDKVIKILRNFRIRTYLNRANPGQLLVLGYLLVMLTGFGLLSLPFVHKQHVSVLDNLYIATSAMSTTGLVTVPVSDTYNFFGQLIILLLFQVGGLGYMSLGSFFVLAGKKRMSNLSVKIFYSEFNLPEGFRLYRFVRQIVYFTLGIEIAGAIALWVIFHSSGVSDAAWMAVFHSVSAFCTAGFSLFNRNFIDFSGNTGLNVVISILSLSGAIGFIVFTDLFNTIAHKKKKNTFTTRIIIRYMLIVLIGGTFIFYLTTKQTNNFQGTHRVMISFFQVMTSITTVGFNTYPVHSLPHASLLLLTLFMVVGASPSGTGGGMKSTTIAALFAEMSSVIFHHRRPALMRIPIPRHRIRIAIAVFLFYSIVLFLGLFVMLLSDTGASLYAVLFESTSALGTVGLSMGITSHLTITGKLVSIILMFLGRIGPLSFGIAFMSNLREPETHQKEEDIVVEE